MNYLQIDADGNIVARYNESVSGEKPDSDSFISVSDEVWRATLDNTGGNWVHQSNGEFIQAPFESGEPSVPQSVTMMQARLAMLSAGILSDVEAAIAAMTGDEGKAAQIQWQFAQQVRRDWPLVASLQKALKLSDKAADDLFIAAAAIE